MGRLSTVYFPETFGWVSLSPRRPTRRGPCHRPSPAPVQRMVSLRSCEPNTKSPASRCYWREPREARCAAPCLHVCPDSQIRSSARRNRYEPYHPQHHVVVGHNSKRPSIEPYDSLRPRTFPVAGCLREWKGPLHTEVMRCTEQESVPELRRARIKSEQIEPVARERKRPRQVAAAK
jgi:hypothetical protein